MVLSFDDRVDLSHRASENLFHLRSKDGSHTADFYVRFWLKIDGSVDQENCPPESSVHQKGENGIQMTDLR